MTAAGHVPQLSPQPVLLSASNSGVVVKVSPDSAAMDPLAQVLTGFLLAYNGATRTAYTSDLRAWITWCATHHLPPLAAARADLDTYVQQLRESGAAPASIARRLATLSGLYTYAVDEGLLSRSPATRVRRPKVGESTVSTGLSREELSALVAAAEADSLRALAAVLLLGLNGLRVSEVCGADGGRRQGHRLVALLPRHPGSGDLGSSTAPVNMGRSCEKHSVDDRRQSRLPTSFDRRAAAGLNKLPVSKVCGSTAS